MIKPFKIKTTHLKQFPELEQGDVGMYAIRVSEDQELMLYETEQIAYKAYQYFRSNFK